MRIDHLPAMCCTIKGAPQHMSSQPAGRKGGVDWPLQRALREWVSRTTGMRMHVHGLQLHPGHKGHTQACTSYTTAMAPA